MAYVRCSSGGGTTSLKDFYRDKVLNGTFDDTVTATVQSNRIVINEGGIGVDTTSKTVYLYFDITINANMTSSNNWYTLATLSNNLSTYLPSYTTSTKGLICLNTDSSSDMVKSFDIGNAGSSYPRTLNGCYNNTFLTGERYYIYGSWTY